MSPGDRANGRPMKGPRAIRDRYTIRDRDMDKAGYAIGGVPERVSDKPISRQNSHLQSAQGLEKKDPT